MQNPWQHKVTLTRNGQEFTVNNPTPYYVIFSNASAQKMAIRQTVSRR